MPTDELMALLKDIRQSRRTPKKIYADAKVGKPKPKASDVTVEQLLNSMSREQIMAALGIGKEK